MKKLYLLLPLIFVLSFLTCKENAKEEEEPPTLDQRLVGARWYFWNRNNVSQPITANGYYEFKNDLTFIHFNKSNQKTEISVYTKNNTVYRKDNNKALLQYQFYSSYPYSNTNEFYIDDDKRNLLNRLAANNNIIACTVYDSGLELIDSSTIIQYRFLRLYKDDGSPYLN
jgi:hypothetical protein